jgi:glucan phosphoethanolaminetransferase (alkaline phosphatase superfamily)
MDTCLLNFICNKELGKRNFIVIHQTCIHAPYSKTFGADFTERNRFSGAEDKRINEYNNAMYYNDDTISKMFNRFNRQKKGSGNFI